MEFEGALSKLDQAQLFEYNKLANLLKVDEHTRNLAIRLYLQYKRFAPSIGPDKVSSLLRCAVFLSEKMQTFVTVSGQQIRGIGLSLNSILRSSNSFDEFIFVLKDFIKRVRLGDAQVEKDINNFIRKFCFILSFHNKFEQTLRKLDLKERDSSETPGYLKALTSMAWLLFIDSRNKILRHSQEVVENMFLLFSVLHYMLCLSSEWVQPAEQFDVSSREVLLARFMKTLNITDTQNFMAIHQQFEHYLNFLCEKEVLRYGRNRSQFLSPQLLLNNYKKLDQRYSKILGIDDLDERLFLKERAATLTPNKLTPFSRQGYTNKRGTGELKLACQRVLGFDDDSLPSQNLNPNFLATRQKEKPEHIDFPPSVVFSPTTSRTPQLGKTPMTVCVEMYNWLHELDDKAKGKGSDTLFKPLAEAAVQAIVGYEWRDVALHSHELKNREKRSNNIMSMYCYLAQGLEMQYPHLYLKEKDFHKGLVQIAAQTTYFALNTTTITFTNLSEVLQVPVYELWKACDAAMQLADSMPAPVKMHLLDIEVNLVSQDVWRSDSTLLSVLKDGGKGDGTHERVFKRVLHQIVYQIYQLSMGLALDQRIGDLVLTTVKYILTNQMHLLVNRHIDQIILCSMYAVCRRASLKKLFNDIRIKYEQLNPNNRHMHTEVICSVYVSPTERLDIIKFYNAVYTPLLQSFIKSLFQGHEKAAFTGASPLPNSLLHSPLKSLLPKDMAKKSTSLRKGGQRSQMMYAYNESPLLKDLKGLKSKDESKRILSDDDDLQGSLAGTQKVGDSKEDVSDYINKRCNILTSRPQKKVNLIRVHASLKNPFTREGKHESALPLELLLLEHASHRSQLFTPFAIELRLGCPADLAAEAVNLLLKPYQNESVGVHHLPELRLRNALTIRYRQGYISCLTSQACTISRLTPSRKALHLAQADSWSASSFLIKSCFQSVINLVALSIRTVCLSAYLVYCAASLSLSFSQCCSNSYSCYEHPLSPRRKWSSSSALVRTGSAFRGGLLSRLIDEPRATTDTPHRLHKQLLPFEVKQAAFQLGWLSQSIFEFKQNHSMFSGTIKLTNIDDYISPAASCVKPIPPAQDGKVQALTLKDCLACSGCVTSAQTILAQKQSLEAFLKLPLGQTIVGLSPQTILHTAHAYKLTLAQSTTLLLSFFSKLQVKAVFTMRMANLVTLLLFEQEYRNRLVEGRLPLLLSQCPGWVCYCEKLGGEKAVSLLSNVKSPQQVFGILAKQMFPECKVAVLMPCYDKKLQSARYAYLKQMQEIDLVLTSNEIQERLDTFVQQEWKGQNKVNEFYWQDGGLAYRQVDETGLIPGCLTNGYTEYLITALGQPFEPKAGRNSDSWQLQSKGHLFALAHGFRNIQNHIRLIKQNKSKATLIEMMACPGACRKGNGFSKLEKEQAAVREAEVMRLAEDGRCGIGKQEWAAAGEIAQKWRDKWLVEYRSVAAVEVAPSW